MTKRRPYSFPPCVRLKKGEEFFTLRKRGRFFKTPHFLVYSLENKSNFSRLGVTVSRKVGNSPARNRVKRLLREYFRQVLQSHWSGYDISIVARSGASRLGLRQVVEELDRVFLPSGRPGGSG